MKGGPMEPTRSILLCDEDRITREFLADNLVADGYQVVPVDSKPAALAKLGTDRPDLVICDVNGDTLGLVDAVRHADDVASRIDPEVPLIVITARGDELERVRYLDRGCDDVLSKPYSYPELRGRVRAVLRRVHGQRRRVIRVGALRIDTLTREVHVGGNPVALTATEYGLLAHLAGDPTRVYTKWELLRDVWRYRAPGRTRTLDCHASRVRRKLGDAGGLRFVETIWGIGYRLAPSDTGEPTGSAA
jgi:DNA-binding response OmpR family regulator